jgi:hypothetical protein
MKPVMNLRPMIGLSRKVGLLNDKVLAEKVWIYDSFGGRVERFEATAFRIRRGKIQARCVAGCWVFLSDIARLSSRDNRGDFIYAS